MRFTDTFYLKFTDNILFVLSELGDGWAPTILETEEEFNFLREAMTAFVMTYKQNVLLGGSTCMEPSYYPIDYSDYIPENVDDVENGKNANPGTLNVSDVNDST